RKLYEGLRAMNFAGKPLHPDVLNLEILLNQRHPPADVVALWLRRLEAETAAGRLRSEIVYLFGALLEEWGRDAGVSAEFLKEKKRTHVQMVAELVAPAKHSSHRALFQQLFDGFGGKLSELKKKMESEIATAFERSASYSWDGLSDIQR